jgi:hypothetical protein
MRIEMRRAGPWLALALALAGGCDEPKKPKTRQILGRTTQDIRPMEPEVKDAGAKVVRKPTITAKDPITLSGNAYTSIIGQTSILLVQDAMNKYQALNDAYPKDFAEFKRDIIEANGIRLPVLPYYQEYGYDDKTHTLVVLEYPDRKEQQQ